MEKLEFASDQKDQIVQKLKLYFDKNLNQEIGRFDAEFLIDFFADEIGAYFYNMGLRDAEVVFAKKLDEVADSIYELERPTESRQ